MRHYILALLLISFAQGNLFAKERKSKSSLETYTEILSMISEAEKIPYSNPQKTLTLANKIISYGEANNENWIIAKGKFLAATAYGNFGDFVTGFEYIQKALDYCPTDSLQLQANILLKKASFFIYLRELSKAKSIIIDAIDVANLMCDSILLAMCYNTMGLTYVHVPDVELAELNFIKSLKINKKIGNRRGMAKNLNNLTLYKSKDLQKRVGYLREAISINKESDQFWALAENYNNLGMQYYYWGDHPNAIKSLDTARIFALKVNARELMQDNNRYFSNVYSGMKNFEPAFKHLRMVLDDVENEKISEKIRDYQSKMLQYTIDTKERNIKEQKQQYNLTVMKYIIAVILLLFVSVICIAAYMINKIKTSNLKDVANSANRELVSIKEQLTNTAMLVKSRGDMLTNIQTQLRESYKLNEEEKLEKLHKISRSISHFNSKNNEMEKLVDKVSSEFINKLSEKFPDLTSNEKRLAALLRIGLSSKEIAVIISSQPKSVDMARYRLRKKMNLECDEGLQDFIKKV